MIANAAAPAALPDKKLRRDTGGFSIRTTSVVDCIWLRRRNALFLRWIDGNSIAILHAAARMAPDCENALPRKRYGNESRDQQRNSDDRKQDYAEVPRRPVVDEPG